MADTFLTLKDLNKLFWTATMDMLDIDTTLKDNQDKVRMSWPTEGAPGWKITDDVVFIRIGDADDDFSIIRDLITTALDSNNAKQTTAYTRVLNVHWVCYGPNSFDNAFLIRNKLYSTDIRDLLNAKQVFFIPEIDSPKRAPELYNGQWWERTNVGAKFNELVTFNSAVPYLQSVTVQTTQGGDPIVSSIEP